MPRRSTRRRQSHTRKTSLRRASSRGLSQKRGQPKTRSESKRYKGAAVEPLYRMNAEFQRLPGVVNALTYNLSWASQANKVAGSEADFVHACQRANRNCFSNALTGLALLQEQIDVAGFQEVEDLNAINLLQQSLPKLDTFFNALVWLQSLRKAVSCLLMWNSTVCGPAVWKSAFDLGNGRPAGMVVTYSTQKNTTFLLVVAHFPWIETEQELKSIEEKFANHMPPKHLLKGNVLPIVMADTNDSKTLIHKDRPFRLGSMRVSQNTTQADLKKTLKTCCWHEEGHMYGRYTDTGDYILSHDISNEYVPKLFADQKDVAFASDHLPVIAHVVEASSDTESKM